MGTCIGCLRSSRSKVNSDPSQFPENKPRGKSIADDKKSPVHIPENKILPVFESKELAQDRKLLTPTILVQMDRKRSYQSRTDNLGKESCQDLSKSKSLEKQFSEKIPTFERPLGIFDKIAKKLRKACTPKENSPNLRPLDSERNLIHLKNKSSGWSIHESSSSKKICSEHNIKIKQSEIPTKVSRIQGFEAKNLKSVKSSKIHKKGTCEKSFAKSGSQMKIMANAPVDSLLHGANLLDIIKLKKPRYSNKHSVTNLNHMSDVSFGKTESHPFVRSAQSIASSARKPSEVAKSNSSNKETTGILGSRISNTSNLLITAKFIEKAVFEQSPLPPAVEGLKSSLKDLSPFDSKSQVRTLRKDSGNNEEVHKTIEVLKPRKESLENLNSNSEVSIEVKKEIHSPVSGLHPRIALGGLAVEQAIQTTPSPAISRKPKSFSRHQGTILNHNSNIDTISEKYSLEDESMEGVDNHQHDEVVSNRSMAMTKKQLLEDMKRRNYTANLDRNDNKGGESPLSHIQQQ